MIVIWFNSIDNQFYQLIFERNIDENYFTKVKATITSGAITKFAIFDCMGNGNTTLIKYLVENGHCDIHERKCVSYEFSNISAIQLAIRKRMADNIIFCLMDCGAEFQPLLGEAIDVGKREVVKYMIERGAFLESTYKFNHTPLFEAVRRGRREMVEMLLNAGAVVDPQGVRYRFKSPLHIAILHG